MLVVLAASVTFTVFTPFAVALAVAVVVCPFSVGFAFHRVFCPTVCELPFKFNVPPFTVIVPLLMFATPPVTFN